MLPRRSHALLLLALLPTPAFATTFRHLHYVGPDQGRFADPAHWSLSPNGPGGQGPPEYSDDFNDTVYIRPATSLTVLSDADTASKAVFLEAQSPSTAVTLHQTTGHLNTRVFYVKATAPGSAVSFIQDSGYVGGHYEGLFELYAAEGATATATLSGRGIRVGWIDIGGPGSVTVHHHDGSMTGNSGGVSIAADPGASVTYHFSNGFIGGDSLSVGGYGVATLYQTGGYVGGTYGVGLGRGSTWIMTGGVMDQTGATFDSFDFGGRFTLAGPALIRAGRFYALPTASFSQSAGSVSVTTARIECPFFLSGGTFTAQSTTLTGSLHQSGGTLDSLSLSGPGSLTISDGSLTTSRFRQLSLTATDRAAVTLVPHPGNNPLLPSTLTSLTLADAATFDLTANTLLIPPSPDGPFPLDTIRSYLHTGHLISSAATPTHTLAAVRAADLPPDQRPTLDGQPLDPATLVIRLTLRGDATLDGLLNQDDYALLEKGFATNGQFWSDGDFNHDGQVNEQDYLLIDRTYYLTKAQGWQSMGSDFLAQRASRFGPTYVQQLLTSIPEPTSLAYLFTLSLLHRTRRKAKLYNWPPPAPSIRSPRDDCLLWRVPLRRDRRETGDETSWGFH